MVAWADLSLLCLCLVGLQVCHYYPFIVDWFICTCVCVCSCIYICVWVCICVEARVILCSCVHLVCMCMHTYMYVSACVWTWRSEVILKYLFQLFSILFSKTWSLPGLGLRNSSKKPDQWIPRLTCLILCWDHSRHHRTGRPKEGTQVFTLVQQALLGFCHLPNPVYYTWLSGTQQLAG